MKKITLILTFASLITVSVNAQDEEQVQEKGFKKENLFTGGSITVSFFNGQTVLGANPIFGYKLTNWLDAGVSLNFLYNGYRDYYATKVEQTLVGPGVFTRIYPVSFLFLQGQYEQNYSTVKYKPAPGSTASPETQKVDAGSFLVGGGFASGRQKGGTTFFYISVLFDVMKNINSPYVNVTYNPSDPDHPIVDVVPIIRAGVNVGLFQGKYR